MNMKRGFKAYMKDFPYHLLFRSSSKSALEHINQKRLPDSHVSFFPPNTSSREFPKLPSFGLIVYVGRNLMSCDILLDFDPHLKLIYKREEYEVAWICGSLIFLPPLAIQSLGWEVKDTVSLTISVTRRTGKHDIFHPVKMRLCNFPNINHSSFRNPEIALCDSSTSYL